jgi:predicted ATPase
MIGAAMHNPRIFAEALVLLLAQNLASLISAEATPANKAVEEVGKLAGEAVSRKVKEIWDLLRGKVEENPVAAAAVQELAQTPDDEDLRAVLRVQLRKLLEGDPDLAARLTPLVEAARPEVNVTRAEAGNQRVAVFSDTISDLYQAHSMTFSKATRGPVFVETIEIRNFKNIGHLGLDLTPPSSLDNDWTCIAGINGAGKSSILQALAMALLGERLVTELGGERIRRFLRRSGTQRLPAEITVTVRDGRERKTLYLPLSEQGVDLAKLNAHPDRSRMIDVWERLQKQVIVGYGASRNLSDYRDTRYSSLSVPVQRQMTLFDSLTQIASVDVLLEGGSSSAPVLKTLKRLLKAVLVEELAPCHSADRIVFSQCGTEVDAIDLPDGFRSTVAWLADLCAAWHRTAPPEETATSDPARISGIALVDEIDLHLHATLQRSLVPRLRAALPNVQFLVTTHSPLVLASFDRAEIVALDRDAENGIRELDRQIFAFSTDQVYEFLMGTPPQSTVIEEKLEKGDDPELELYLYQSKDRSEEEARVELEERRRLIEELRGAAPR